jgi:hypothetical protein
MPAVPFGDSEVHLEGAKQDGAKTGRIRTQDIVDRIAGGSPFATALVAQLDADRNGTISIEELTHAINSAAQTKQDLEKEKHMSGLLRKGIFALVLVLVCMFLINMGMTYSVVILAKDTKVSSDGSMTSTDGKAVKIASADYSTDQHSRLLSRTTGKPMKTASSGKSAHPLTSKVPDRYFAELTHFTYGLPGSDPVQTIYAKVQAFVRVPQKGALCGSIVRLITTDGNYTLDEEHLYSTKYGAIEITASGQFDVERRLDGSHGRRLQVSALEGFFNFIEESDFECYTEWKGTQETVEPVPPKYPMSYTSFVDKKCVRKGLNRCVPSNSLDYPLKPGSDESATTMQVVKKVLLTEDKRYEVSFFPNHPGQRSVSFTDLTAKTKTTYQLFQNHKDLLYCNKVNVRADALPNGPQSNGTLLSYLGTTEHTFHGKTSTLRRWRLTPGYMSKPGPNGENPPVSAMELWDDKATKTMYRLYPGPEGPGSSMTQDQIFQDVQEDLDTTKINVWLDEYLSGTHNPAHQAGCNAKMSRVAVTAKSDRSKTYKLRVPAIDRDVFSESDSEWYAGHYPTGGVAGEQPGSSWWRPSFTSYWSKQVEHGTVVKKLKSLEIAVAEIRRKGTNESATHFIDSAAEQQAAERSLQTVEEVAPPGFTTDQCKVLFERAAKDIGFNLQMCGKFEDHKTTA